MYLNDILALQELELELASEETPLMCSGLSIGTCSVAQTL
ncbi:hypothetical protein B005_1458 [Nocardiopsis alba ATCC BAA-2165]|uniref:Uncharacterized protein n=1 Tax=Nocardiopsis alba (strain ATCC BAA-2165 / BE74) TaxID=1205910 RepID=J7LB37_NOCAA|nr:hypothetical protein B005_1458 [Nocardiopsis alba ATCC BAA-2165]